MLEGPTAVAFVAGDPVAAAKKVVDAAKKFPALILKGGYMEGKVLSADEAKGLADLDSKEVMLSKIAGLLKGEMSRAASMFVSAQSKFLSLLEAYKEKVPDDSVVEDAPATDSPVVDEAPAAAEPAAVAEPEPAAVESEQAAEPESPSEPQAADAEPEAQPDAAPEQPDAEGEE